MQAETELAQFPHCDQRVLHEPGTCEFCDWHPDWQALREAWGISFTGLEAGPGMLPCPADAARLAGSSADHRRWGGNKPTSAEGDPSWPAETAASRALYGDKGGRGPWPLRERIRRRLIRPLAGRRLKSAGFRRDGGRWHYP